MSQDNIMKILEFVGGILLVVMGGAYMAPSQTSGVLAGMGLFMIARSTGYQGGPKA